MNWTVVFTINAEKDLEKIPYKYVEKVISKLEEISQSNPYDHLNKLKNSSFYKFRVGVYRVIVDIINDKLILHIIKIKHRSQAYKI